MGCGAQGPRHMSTAEQPGFSGPHPVQSLNHQGLSLDSTCRGWGGRIVLGQTEKQTDTPSTGPRQDGAHTPFHLPLSASSLSPTASACFDPPKVGSEAGVPHSRFIFMIKAQCRSSIYSTGKGSQGARRKGHFPLSSVTPLLIQRGSWEEVTGSCGPRHFLLWDKLEGHGCHYV